MWWHLKKINVGENMDRSPRIVMLGLAIMAVWVVVGTGTTLAVKASTPAKEPAKEPRKQGEGFFEVLKVGDQVGVKEIAGKYKIMLDGRPVGSKVVDIGSDFIAVEDPAGTTTRIPVTSVLCISDMRKVLEK